MKKFLIIFGLTVPLLLATVQAATPEQTDKALDEFFSKYSGKEGYTTMELTGELLKAAYNKGGNNDAGDMFRGVERMRIVVAGKSTAEFAVDVNALPPKTDLKLVSSVNENGKSMKMYYRAAVPATRGKDKRSAEFFMFILGSSDNVLIHITGDFDIRNISKLSGIGIGAK